MMRLNIVHAVHEVSQFMHASRINHLSVSNRIFGTCMAPWTMAFSFVLPLLHPLLVVKTLVALVIRYSMFMISSPDTQGSNLLFLKACTQAEYKAMGYTIRETVWIRKFLCDLRICLFGLTKV